METKPNDFVDLTGNDSPADPCRGLTKREHFASLALQGMLSNPDYTKAFIKTKVNAEIERKVYSELSVKMADSLIKALNAKES